MAGERHTPGPWIVVPYSRSGPKIEVKDSGHRIECPGTGGAMSYTISICEMSWSGTDEWKANAHLIAAAPTMYEALQQAHAFIADQFSDARSQALDGEHVSPEARPVWNAICDALAKAEGA